MVMELLLHELRLEHQKRHCQEVQVLKLFQFPQVNNIIQLLSLVIYDIYYKMDIEEDKYILQG